jgi:hypothetical protein
MAIEKPTVNEITKQVLKDLMRIMTMTTDTGESFAHAVTAVKWGWCTAILSAHIFHTCSTFSYKIIVFLAVR